MRSMKMQIILLVVWFALVFNLDELVLNGNRLNLFVYGLMIIVSVALLSLPALAQLPIAVSGGAVAVLYGISYFIANALNNTPFDALPFIIGAVAVLGTFCIIRWISRTQLPAPAEAQNAYYGANVQPVYSQIEGEDRINDELYRARRFERPASVVYVQKPPQPDAYKSLMRIVAGLTFKGDLIADYGDCLVIGLPETDRRNAGIFVNQLGRSAHDTLNTDVVVGFSVFPEDGLVCDELVKVAQSNAKEWSEDDYSGFVGERKGDLMVELPERVRIETQGEWVNRLPQHTAADRKLYHNIKRGVDILFVTALMPFLIPVLGIVALLIWVDDRKTVFFMQPRTGYGGKRFQMYKFRTMRVGAKSVPPQVIVAPDGTMRYMWPEKVDNDPRITRIGRFLRKTSLDELPQLLNILQGDMSLIGPRPTTWNLDMYTSHQTSRLVVRPGITGLWQVSARDATNFDERLMWDLKYIEKVSVWLDIKIVWLTVMGVFQKSGA